MIDRARIARFRWHVLQVAATRAYRRYLDIHDQKRARNTGALNPTMRFDRKETGNADED